MSEVKLSREVAASVQRVWEVFTDLGNSAVWRPDIERVEVLTPGAFKVGTTWRETRVVAGQTAVEQLTVTICEPPSRCVIEARHKGEHHRTEFLFTPLGDTATLVDLTFASEPQGIGRVVGAVLGRRDSAETRSLEQDLDDLAAAAKASG